ncbi:rCG24040 [Rattus norvegicus]|uniref:RCG24040 n=1 Tax=Rattus norvegicus TaxID=10116 RepID=A6JWD8_RAT|nr:rCG24040 [Rattus norvegicus]
MLNKQRRRPAFHSAMEEREVVLVNKCVMDQIPRMNCPHH